MNLQKQKRLEDAAAIRECKENVDYHCEVCHQEASDSHHYWYSKGAGGPDHRFNLICLCRVCHRKAHDGAILAGFLLNIVARREKKTAMQIVEKLQRLRLPYQQGEI